ncbi:MAG: CARDB domain-containing protein [Candidatus Pacearchaeota archaeon]|nr:CARDB domain-containing protein [Candidatus Pacearchaeota archaeon]
MIKKGSTFGVLIMMFLLVILGFLLYFLYLNLPGKEAVGFEQVVGNVETIIVGGVSEQFYENMRYRDKKISYVISENCGEKKRVSMEEAFSKLEDLTVLEFFPSDNPELSILCEDLAPEAGHEDYFVAGEGGPSEVINGTLYSVILSGEIALFREERCSESKIAVHELLHALGFNHNGNPNSILYPTLDCNQKIDDEIINDINRLYSFASLPDLKIHTVNATKAGRYLNFYIEVLNQGLWDAYDADLTIKVDGKEVQDFHLETIKIGARKILSVENLKISGSAERITFVIDNKNMIDEIFENNNDADLILRTL